MAVLIALQQLGSLLDQVKIEGGATWRRKNFHVVFLDQFFTGNKNIWGKQAVSWELFREGAFYKMAAILNIYVFSNLTVVFEQNHLFCIKEVS